MAAVPSMRILTSASRWPATAVILLIKTVHRASSLPGYRTDEQLVRGAEVISCGAEAREVHRCKGRPYARLPRQRPVTRARRHPIGRFPLRITVAVCTVLSFVGRDPLVEPTAAQAAQTAAAASTGLEVLEVRPNFFMIAGAGANIGVQVG